jgi:D-glycero-beta-D-manno-heptose 1-phosphate adenylyltransferase
MKKKDILLRKLYTRENIVTALTRWRFLGQKIVFTNGCFDLIHLGHIDYLAQAADHGLLIVGVNTDASVRRIKGPSRPVNDEVSRSMVIAALSFVEAVILFDEDTPLDLITLIQPDILVKGDDYSPEEIVGYDVVKAKGGEVRTIALVPGYSSSSIERKILEQARINKQ